MGRARRVGAGRDGVGGISHIINNVIELLNNGWAGGGLRRAGQGGMGGSNSIINNVEMSF